MRYNITLVGTQHHINAFFGPLFRLFPYTVEDVAVSEKSYTGMFHFFEIVDQKKLDDFLNRKILSEREFLITCAGASLP